MADVCGDNLHGSCMKLHKIGWNLEDCFPAGVRLVPGLQYPIQHRLEQHLCSAPQMTIRT